MFPHDANSFTRATGEKRGANSTVSRKSMGTPADGENISLGLTPIHDKDCSSSIYLQRVCQIQVAYVVGRTWEPWLRTESAKIRCSRLIENSCNSYMNIFIATYPSKPTWAAWAR